MKKLKLQDFNNLSKSLGLCLYKIFYSKKEINKKKYLADINQFYSTKCLTRILSKICSIIGANILYITHQEYMPQGASVNILISEYPLKNQNSKDIVSPANFVSGSFAHIDKSHICVHTYPESHPKDGICTFRVDIEISTCGVISPLKAINYIVEQLKVDMATIDYRIRGFTRDIHGKKHFIDHKIMSIQDFLSNELKINYKMDDINIYQENIYHTKMLMNKFILKEHVFNDDLEHLSKKEEENLSKTLQREMKEICYACNFL